MKSFVFELEEFRNNRIEISIWLVGGFNVKGKVESLGFKYVKMEKTPGDFFFIPIDKICMFKVV